jgi:hypothetical protein
MERRYGYVALAVRPAIMPTALRNTMAVVINPNNEDIRQLSAEEGRAFFDAAVQEQLGITGQEFLKRRNEFKNNPHFDSIMFLLPLVENVPE